MRADIVFRRGKPADSRAAFDLGIEAMRDLMARQNQPLMLDADAFWLALQPYIEHLVVHAAEWWVAEDPSDESLIGHARSIERAWPVRADGTVRAAQRAGRRRREIGERARGPDGPR
jgi:hypothetical protein